MVQFQSVGDTNPSESKVKSFILKQTLQAERELTRAPADNIQTHSSYQKVIGDGPHAFMRQNNPDDHHVTDHGHRNDAAVSDSPECDLPHRLDELVEAVAAVNGGVRPVGGVKVGGIVERVHLSGIRSWVLKIDQRPVPGVDSFLGAK